ncbi:MAG: hypothetical protein GX577_04205 [Leptolinea sp.]|nr:hypothetical protein [Leptolinea sp.]
MPEKQVTNLDELNTWMLSMESRTRKNEDFDKKVYSGFVAMDALIKKQSREVKKWKAVSLLTSIICFFDIVLIVGLIVLLIKRPDGIAGSIPFLVNLVSALGGK